MYTQSFQVFKASSLMWPQAHRWSLKRAFMCALLKFDDVKIFDYTLL